MDPETGEGRFAFFPNQHGHWLVPGLGRAEAANFFFRAPTKSAQLALLLEKRIK
jgi:hypothetical protein